MLLLDGISAAGFASAIALVARCPRGIIKWQAKLLFITALGIYLAVALSGALDHAGVTPYFHRFEDYIKDLFIPFFLFGLFAMRAQWELDRRLRAEKLLRVGQERYRTLVENVDLGITLLSKEFVVLTANRSMARMLRQPPESVVGEKCYAIYQHRNDVCADCPGVVAMRDGGPAILDKQAVRRDGTTFAVRIHAFPLFDAEGAPEGFIEVVEDRTQQKLLEEERRLLDAQVLEAQKSESMGTLAGGIAHDFNNLLMGVVGNADLTLLKLPADSPCRTYMERIQSIASRASELTSQLVAYSGRGTFEMGPVSLNELVENTSMLLEAVVSKKTLLQYQLEPSLPAVAADATQIREVLLNLIVNASEALGEEPGVVTTATGTLEMDRACLLETHLGADLPAGRYVTLRVSDTGPGLGRETLERLFDPFFTTKFLGRGLGLAAVLGIVRRHRGAIRVESEPGQGTTFEILLPSLEGGAMAEEPASPHTFLPHQGLGMPVVLVIDDEETVRSVCRMMLEEFGFSVRLASNGREALEVVAQEGEAIAAVVLDLAMPEMEGEETARRLRELRPQLPVILSSGYEEPEIIARFGGQEYSALLRKPFRAAELLDAVNRAVAEQEDRATERRSPFPQMPI